MTNSWEKTDSVVNYAVKLAALAVRAQRLVLARRIDTIQAMVDIHGPSLQQHPDGKAVLTNIREQLQAMKQALQGNRP